MKHDRSSSVAPFMLLLAVVGARAAYAQPPDPNIGDAVLNEILFNPHNVSPNTNIGQDCDGDGFVGEDGNAVDSGDEFVELFNIGANDINLEGYCLSNASLANGDPAPGGNSRWLIPSGETLPAGGYWHICGNDDGRGAGFSNDDANGDQVTVFANSGTRFVSIYQPTTPGDCNSVVDTVVFSTQYPTNESNGESFKACPDGAALGYVDDPNGFFYAPTPGGSNCAIATPVTVVEFSAEQIGQGTRFEWTTSNENAVIGFHLYRRVDESWKRINPRLIASDDSVAQNFHQYVWETRQLESQAIDNNEFLLVEVDAQLTERAHGPFGWGTTPPRHSRPTKPSAVDWQQIQAEQEVTDRSRAETFGAAPVAELLVDRDLIYRLTFEDLLAEGIDLTGVRTGDLALVERAGEAVPIYLSAGSEEPFGPGLWLEFLGRPVDSLYTQTRVYQLLIDPSRATRAGVESRPPPPGVAPLEAYRETLIVDDNRQYSISAPGDDPWFAERLLTYEQPQSWSFSFQIDNLSTAPNQAELEVELWGGVDWPDVHRDHHAIVELNGLAVGEVRFDGLVAATLRTEIPLELLQEGDNTLTVTLPGDTGAAFDLVQLDRYSVRYPRRFVAQNGALQFNAAGERISIEGLVSAEPSIYGFAFDGSVRRFTGLEVSGEPGSYIVDIPGSGRSMQYYVSSPESVLRPQIRSAGAAPELSQAAIDYLIISHPLFLESLEPLISAREADGYRVELVDAEEIYTAYSSALVDPEAIRTHIVDAATARGATYVLLVGGDTYDYFDRLELGSISHLPSLYAATDEIVRFAPADALYADIDHDLVPDLAIGRLPVRTAAELEMLVEKITRFEERPVPGNALFVADRDEGALSFAAESERFAEHLPSDWSSERVYLSDDLEIEPTRELLLDELNTGPTWVNFFGHSNSFEWTSQALLAAGDAATLTNLDPMVVNQWGCWNSYYVEPLYNTLAHELLLHPTAGAIAVLGLSTLAAADGERYAADRMTEEVFVQGQTLGGAMLEVKRALAEQQLGPIDQRLDLLLGWTLLGDPAVEIER